MVECAQTVVGREKTVVGRAQTVVGLVAIQAANAASNMVEGSGVRSRRVRRTLKARMVGASDMVEAKARGRAVASPMPAVKSAAVVPAVESTATAASAAAKVGAETKSESEAKPTLSPPPPTASLPKTPARQ